MTKLSMERDAALMGIHQVVGMVDGQHVTRWRVGCECGAEQLQTFSPTMRPEGMATIFRKAGWIMGRRAPVCKNCNKKVIKMNMNPKLARQVYNLLDAHFDDNKRLYNDGWSDQRIATDLNMSLTAIEKVRREAYGELAEDPAIASGRRVVAELTTQFAEEVRAIRQLLDEAEKRVEEGLEQIRRKLVSK